MRKIACLFLIVLLFSLQVAASIAEDFGVQEISPDSSVVGVTDDLSDMQLGSTYDISSYGKITVQQFKVIDYFCQYEKDHAGDNTYTRYEKHLDKYTDFFINYNASNNVLKDVEEYGNGERCSFYEYVKWILSGPEADFVCLDIDINNITSEPKSYLEDIRVLLIEDDTYQFTGWALQYNETYNDIRFQHKNEMTYNPHILAATELINATKTKDDNPVLHAALNNTDAEKIEIRYNGHYAIGCTLPNDVINNTTPLKIVINFGDVEATYYIRK